MHVMSVRASAWLGLGLGLGSACMSGGALSTRRAKAHPAPPSPWQTATPRVSRCISLHLAASHLQLLLALAAARRQLYRPARRHAAQDLAHLLRQRVAAQAAAQAAALAAAPGATHGASPGAAPGVRPGVRPGAARRRGLERRRLERRGLVR